MSSTKKSEFWIEDEYHKLPQFQMINKNVINDTAKNHILDIKYYFYNKDRDGIKKLKQNIQL